MSLVGLDYLARQLDIIAFYTRGFLTFDWQKQPHPGEPTVSKQNTEEYILSFLQLSHFWNLPLRPWLSVKISIRVAVSILEDSHLSMFEEDPKRTLSLTSHSTLAPFQLPHPFLHSWRLLFTTPGSIENLKGTSFCHSALIPVKYKRQD